MQADELDHIRADVHAAILEAQQHDPTVTLEILWRLLDEIGVVALAGPWHSIGPLQVCCRCSPDAWSASLLRDVQTRAVSKVPYGEAPTDEPPEDHRD